MGAIFALIFFALFGFGFYCFLAWVDKRPGAIPLWACRLFAKKAEIKNINVTHRSDGDVYCKVDLTWKPKDCSHKITNLTQTNYRNTFIVQDSKVDIEIPFTVQLGAWWHLQMALRKDDAKRRAEFYKKFAATEENKS